METPWIVVHFKGQRCMLSTETAANACCSPQVDVKQLQRIESLVRAGAKDGVLVQGGHRHGTKVDIALAYHQGRGLQFCADVSQGAFMEPTILLNVDQGSTAYREEIFGPVVIVNTFESEEEVLAEANGVEFGLFCKFLCILIPFVLLIVTSVRVHQRLRASHSGCQGS